MDVCPYIHIYIYIISYIYYHIHNFSPRLYEISLMRYGEEVCMEQNTGVTFYVKGFNDL